MVSSFDVGELQLGISSRVGSAHNCSTCQFVQPKPFTRVIQPTTDRERLLVKTFAVAALLVAR